MARQLTIEEIEELASGRGVRRIAVENFLVTADASLPVWQHQANLRADSRSYKWNAATVRAIAKGLELMYSG